MGAFAYIVPTFLLSRFKGCVDQQKRVDHALPVGMFADCCAFFLFFSKYLLRSNLIFFVFTWKYEFSVSWDMVVTLLRIFTERGYNGQIRWIDGAQGGATT